MTSVGTNSEPAGQLLSPLARWLALAGAAGPLLFVLVSTVAGLLRPGYSFVHEAISELGAGLNAWIQNANFALTGLMLIAFAIGLYPALRPVIGGRRRLPACIMLLVLSGVGMAGAAYFTVGNPTDPPEQQMITGILHGVCFILVFVPLAIALIFLGRQLRRVPAWRGSGTHALAAGSVTLALFPIVYLLFAVDAPLAGLVLRVMVLVAFSWHVVAGWRLFARGGPRERLTLSAQT